MSPEPTSTGRGAARQRERSPGNGRGSQGPVSVPPALHGCPAWGLETRIGQRQPGGAYDPDTRRRGDHGGPRVGQGAGAEGAGRGDRLLGGQGDRDIAGPWVWLLGAASGPAPPPPSPYLLGKVGERAVPALV